MNTVTATLPAVVASLIPLTIEDGRVYEQLVIGEVVSGTRIAIFDPDLRVSAAFVGKRCLFHLSAFMPAIEVLGGERYDIDGWENHGTTTVLQSDEGETVAKVWSSSIHNRAFSGRIMDFVGNRALIDLRQGTILSDLDPSVLATRGDFVRITSFRLDIEGNVELQQGMGERGR